jgi:hypothetical protein
MARLCVRIAANDHPTDAALNDLRTHEGDVVVVMPDTHQFSQAELTNGQYRILDLPGVPEEEMSYLMAPIEDGAGTMTKRRAVKLDETVLKSPTWEGKTSATKAEIEALTVVKV